MGCCVSKKRSEPPGTAGEAERRKVVEARDLAPPEEEKVKEVLSETPRVKPRRVAGAVVAPSAEKANAKEGGARAKDVGGGDRVGRRAARPARSVEEKSEAASESSAATTAARPTPRRAPEAPCQQPSPSTTQARPHEPTRCASPPAPVQEDDPPGSDTAGYGDGKESLENPLVSMECFIFL